VQVTHPPARTGTVLPLGAAHAKESGGGRPATGSIVWADPETKTHPIGVRVTKADGKRKLVRFDAGTTPDDARALAPVLAERARVAVAEHEGETMTRYAERWCDWRAARGLECVAGDRTRLARHVLPSLGSLELARVTRDDLKRLVAVLDEKVKRGFTVDPDGKRKPFGWKSASNVWATVRALFRDAQRAKRIDLCVRDDNPAAGLAGPDAGAHKAKAYLWPSEFVALVSCDRVPLRWRRLFALAVYTYARAGEVAALEWGDVDLEHATIHIHRSTDGTREHAKATKTDTARRVPIEPALLPLLQALYEEAKGRRKEPTGGVFRMPSTSRSWKLRAFLERAGITRADLFASDATRKAITFHDLRATGITWCAVRGDDALRIMQRAGHADFATTRIYMREAENLAAGFGTVFPPLPAVLLKRPTAKPGGVSASVSAFGVDPGSAPLGIKRFVARHRGFEPLTYGSGVALEGSAPVSSASQPVGIIRKGEGGGVQPSHPLAPVRTPFGPMVVQGSSDHQRRLTLVRGGPARLLTVRDVADWLGVCTAVVYALVADGRLRHLRVSNAIRIAPADLTVFVAHWTRTAQDRGERAP